MLKHFLAKVAMLIALIASCSYALPAPDKTTETLDAVVAIVNNQVITKTELDQAMNYTQQQIQQSGATPPNQKKLQEQVINTLIDRALQLQLAKQNKIKVSDRDVDQQILVIAKHNNTDLAGLKTQLANSHLSYPAFRDRIREQLLIQQIQQGVVAGSISVTAGDIAQYRAAHANDIDNTEYNIADILIPVNNPKNRAELNGAHNRALKIMQTIDSGNSPRTTAQQYQASYNELGWRSYNDLPTLFAKPAATTQKGGLAGPLLAPNGYHVLIVLDKRNSAAQMSDEQIRNLVAEQQANAKIKDWLADIHKTAYIKISPEYE